MRRKNSEDDRVGVDGEQTVLVVEALDVNAADQILVAHIFGDDVLVEQAQLVLVVVDAVHERRTVGEKVRFLPARLAVDIEAVGEDAAVRRGVVPVYFVADQQIWLRIVHDGCEVAFFVDGVVAAARTVAGDIPVVEQVIGHDPNALRRLPPKRKIPRHQGEEPNQLPTFKMGTHT